MWVCHEGPSLTTCPVYMAVRGEFQDTASEPIYWFADALATPDRVYTRHYHADHRDPNTPIVIDNGSWQCRVGWASEDTPLMVFNNVTARMRGKKGEPDYPVVGNDIPSIELARSTLKSQFDHNIVSNYTVQEQVFDHAFLHLGLGDESSVHHPVLVTEPACNLTSCRAAMSELLFEGYGVPQVCYGVDALFSLYHSCLTSGSDVTDALVMCSGYQTTHILPVVNGRFVASHSKRINVGGWHTTLFLQCLLRLKYPWLQAMITPSRVQELVHHHCYVAGDYKDELCEVADPRTVQLPYSLEPAEALMDPLLKEEKDLQRRQRARDQLLKLNQRKKEEKIAELEKQLEALIHLQQLAPLSDPDEYQHMLEESGLSSMESLLQAIQSVQEALEVERSRLEATVQRLHTDTRSEQAPAHGEQADLQWVETLQMRKKELLEQRKSRHHLRQELSKRRSAASQNRMRIISQLAEDNPKGSKHDDTFGMNDDDWNVYLTISKTAGESDSEREEAELTEINKLLVKHDPAAAGKGAHSASSRDIATHYQLHMQVERFRCPEVVFQPAMVGVDQCGLATAVEMVLNSFPKDQQQRLVNNVLVTGGNTMLPNFEHRVERELRAIRPFQSSFNVTSSSDRLHGGWKGAALWARGGEKEGWTTQSCYRECGADYLSEHVASNCYIKPHT